ncbi:thiamine phosphate synthase [Coxiella endosymbiont of Amblyomma americanum]|uniref:thiamine phosphate synthase n=1 Tax=Coxiella endosymbiont of Amblyomma americanum TaxID=325775 RepID=UPI000581CD4A|nr:thiamine phosphate synthase [Coxiella endosymbiont of Amblyomma americanum]AJC50474.1 thiamine-phosphate pyrophosphorylase [Coxiella endosymbiont of Amblyomma americanum]AUJ58814.1 thiamine-phosphate diphosphorylase [Coxiella-like endosymbiont of Amblyomma americanum]
MKKKIIWVMGGSDCSSGSGCQADVLTCCDFNVHAATVITTITAQNAQEVLEVKFCDAHLVQTQIASLEKVFVPSVIKLGLLGRKAIFVVSSYLKKYKGFVVCDPILRSTSGVLFIEPHDLKNFIFPYVDLLTPNIPESEMFFQEKIHSQEDMVTIARAFLKLGVKSILLKGGHLNANEACDFFTNGKKEFWLVNPRIKGVSVRGTGCSLSSAISSAVARGYSLEDAVVLGKMYVYQGIRSSFKIEGNALLGRQGFPRRSVSLPSVTQRINSATLSTAFPSCGKLGFYPIVDSIAWVKKLLTWGIRTIQLRIKNQKLFIVKRIIAESVNLARRYYRAKLFINDYWKLAIESGAYGVHLGQDDLKTADISAIRSANLRLGISTHSLYELACAHAALPSYIAFGPIYKTTSKVMRFLPQGLSALRYWHKISPYPIVAIGGINLERLEAVLSTGVTNIAVISAVTMNDRPKKIVSDFHFRISYFSKAFQLINSVRSHVVKLKKQ